MKFDEFKGFDMRIGEVLEIVEGGTKINYGENDFLIGLKLDVNVGDKVFVGVCEGGLVVPLVGGGIVVPEKDIGVGVKIS